MDSGKCRNGRAGELSNWGLELRVKPAGRRGDVGDQAGGGAMPGHMPRPSSMVTLKWVEIGNGRGRHRDVGRASIRASNWPMRAAKGPGLPSSSSMRRVSGRRLTVPRGQPPPGVYQLRTEGYHNRTGNV